jgi:hypothetical protein
VRNCIVWASLGAFPTLFTFRRVNMGTLPAHFNGAKLTCIDTCLPNTVLAILCNRIAGNRAVLTCGADNLDHIPIIHRPWRLAFCQTDPLPDNFPLFVDAATEFRCRPWNQFQRNMVPLRIQFPCKCQLCHFVKYIMFDPNYIFISIHHILPLS